MRSKLVSVFFGIILAFLLVGSALAFSRVSVSLDSWEDSGHYCTLSVMTREDVRHRDLLFYRAIEDRKGDPIAELAIAQDTVFFQFRSPVVCKGDN